MPAVPEDLMARLRAANEQFHQAAQRADGLDQMDTAQRGSLAASLRAAEKELEDVTREIAAFLAPPPPQSPAPPSPA
jgi:hypothetical protein